MVPPAAEPDAPGRADGPGGTFLSPAVRRLADEVDVDLAIVEATGADGRVTVADVRRAADVAAPSPDSDVAPADVPRPADDEVIPFTPIRKRIAEHMTRSLATSAHTLVVVEVDYQSVELARDAHKEGFRAREGFGLSYLPFVARAVVAAIGEYPRINASVVDQSLVVHRRINLGIAVDLDFEGLIVPVVHDAQSLGLVPLARAIAHNAELARTRKLRPDGVAGGTFTISNAGGFGTLMTGPIINQPQVAILSTDGVAMRPTAVQDPDGSWAVAVHPMGNVAISFDHRANDGAYASSFLARVKELLQTYDFQPELAEST